MNYFIIESMKYQNVLEKINNLYIHMYKLTYVKPRMFKLLILNLLKNTLQVLIRSVF